MKKERRLEGFPNLSILLDDNIEEDTFEIIDKKDIS